MRAPSGASCAGILRDEMERRVAHLIEAIEIRLRIEPRILDARDQERRRGQIRSRAIGGVGDLFRERLGHDDLSQHRARPAPRGSGMKPGHDQLGLGAQLGFGIGVGHGDAAQIGAAGGDEAPSRILDRDRSPRHQIAAGMRRAAARTPSGTAPDAACCARSDRRRRSPGRASAARHARARPRSRAVSAPDAIAIGTRCGGGANEIGGAGKQHLAGGGERFVALALARDQLLHAASSIATFLSVRPP